MRLDIKICVVGPDGAGKATFISHWTPHGSPEQPIRLNGTPGTSIQIGEIVLDDALTLYLYNAGSMRNADPVGLVLADGCIGLLVLADSTQPGTFPEVEKLLEVYNQFVPERALVIANKQDARSALSFEQVRSRINRENTIIVEPCVATREESCKQALLRLLHMIIAWYDADDLRGDVT